DSAKDRDAVGLCIRAIIDEAIGGKRAAGNCDAAGSIPKSKRAGSGHGAAADSEIADSAVAEEAAADIDISGDIDGTGAAEFIGADGTWVVGDVEAPAGADSVGTGSLGIGSVAAIANVFFAVVGDVGAAVLIEDGDAGITNVFRSNDMEGGRIVKG